MSLVKQENSINRIKIPSYMLLLNLQPLVPKFLIEGKNFKITYTQREKINTILQEPKN